MLPEAEVIVLRRRWQDILIRVHAGLALYGIDASDVIASGSPMRLQIGTYAEVFLAEGPGQPQVQIRALRPGNGVLVADLEHGDAEVAADILECVAALHWRRQRRTNGDRAAIETELAEMVGSTGWECVGVSGRHPRATFRSWDDRIRGEILRSDSADGEPAAARFSIMVETAGFGYAEALAALAALRRACTTEGPARREGSVFDPAEIAA